MTAAQKLAKEKFKKAIAIRSKTGVSLKEAFAQVYGKKKVGAVKKKAAKKVVKKAAPKKTAKKVIQKNKPRYSAKEHKNWGVIPEHRRRVNGLPKKKKVSEKSILNKIHKVKNEVNSLDELQHKHMVGAIEKDALRRIADLNSTIIMRERQYKRIVSNKKRWVESYGLASYQKILKSTRNIISELKKHKSELKKLI
jgi:hypothetical protein